jgi:XTP/dITP diphosphohydrolase
MHFYIGTTNQDKVKEIASILNATGCTFKVTDPVDPEETEDDFEGNALLKARVYAKHAGGITISEDSGLIVPALNGLPGPWSARFLRLILDKDFNIKRIEDKDLSKWTREHIDYANNLFLLGLMENIEQPYRAAAFKVVFVVADSNGDVLFKSTGESHGWIAEEMRGDNGFGYDPVFIGNDTFGKTYAELDSMRKNLRSHRKQALQEFKIWLGNHLKDKEE